MADIMLVTYTVLNRSLNCLMIISIYAKHQECFSDIQEGKDDG